ncbi:hypothetical protein WA026_014276 [Henosepilachna vigintioctopunctata]|uniref:Uncharacterized protein n=1 Tax=Henosepilachna vigintioctopunctata TaxID=420089 RepID=A0AAW1TVH7_9CUCU
MITNICKPRTNVTDEDLARMKSGNFDGLPREAQCFLNCVLVSNKWQNKDNTFNEAASLAATKMLPEKYHTEAKEVISICKDSAKSLDDKCVSATEISKCFFDNSDQIRKFVS